MVEACERRILKFPWRWTRAKSPKSLNARAGMPGPQVAKVSFAESSRCGQEENQRSLCKLYLTNVERKPAQDN